MFLPVIGLSAAYQSSVASVNVVQLVDLSSAQGQVFYEVLTRTRDLAKAVHP